MLTTINISKFDCGPSAPYLAEELASDIHIPLLRLYDVERKLDAGRFSHFTHEACRYVVRLPLPFIEAATGQKIDWIADRVMQPWNLFVPDPWGDDTKLFYSFSECSIAAQFRLTFEDRG